MFISHNFEHQVDISNLMMNLQIQRAVDRYGDRVDVDTLARAISEGFDIWVNSDDGLFVSLFHPLMPMSAQDKHLFLVDRLTQHNQSSPHRLGRGGENPPEMYRVRHVQVPVSRVSQFRPLDGGNQPPRIFHPTPQQPEMAVLVENPASSVAETRSESPSTVCSEDDDLIDDNKDMKT